MDKIFCMYNIDTEKVTFENFNKNDIDPENEDIITLITEGDINELVSCELQPYTHTDSMEDYKSPLEFYTSCIKKDWYIDSIINQFEEIDDKIIDENLAKIIQKEVLKRITEKFNGGVVKC